MRYLRSPTLSATFAASWSQWNKTVMLHHLEIKGCVSIRQAHSSADTTAWGRLVTRLVVKYTTLFQGWMTAISAKLMVWHLFFPVDISIWWTTENGLEFSLLWSYMYCMYCNASLPPPLHSPKLVLLQSFEDNLNVSSCFVFHRFTLTVLIHIDRLTVT